MAAEHAAYFRNKALAQLGTAGVVSEIVEALGLPASPALRDSLFFIVEGVLNGKRVRILCDTGASISFIANHFVQKFGFKVCTLPQEEEGLTVRLGDNSTSPINRRIVQQEFNLGGHHSKENFYVRQRELVHWRRGRWGSLSRSTRSRLSRSVSCTCAVSGAVTDDTTAASTVLWIRRVTRH